MHYIAGGNPVHNNPGDLHEKTRILFPFCRTIRSDVGTLASYSAVSLIALLVTIAPCATEQISVTNTKTFSPVNVKVSCNCEEITDRMFMYRYGASKIVQRILW
jgi:hypothetical protein